MRTFLNSAAHRNTMQKLPEWCNEASYHHWTKPESTLPGWSLASQKLLEEGNLSKVRKPSVNQANNNFLPISGKGLKEI